MLYSNEFEDMQALVWSAMLQQSNISFHDVFIDKGNFVMIKL